MIRIFGDKIDEFIFPNEVKRFTDEENSLIEKFMVSLIKLYKDSDLDNTYSKQYYDRIDDITGLIRKEIYLNGDYFYFTFAKLFKSGVKKKDYIRYSEFINDGSNSRNIKDTDKFKEELEKDKYISGIYVSCFKDSDYIIGEGGEHFSHDYPIRTRYGGSELTSQCLNRIENYHFKKFIKIIKESFKKKKKKKKRKL